MYNQRKAPGEQALPGALEFALNHSGWGGGVIALLMAIYYPDKVKKAAAFGANLTPDTTAFYPFFYKQVIHRKASALDHFSLEYNDHT